MKKVVCLVCLLAFSFSASFGQSENEIKYKWNKLNLITKFKSGVTATWSEYKGYSLTETGVGYGALRIKPESTQDIEDWCITRGNEKISESEFLSLIGKPEEAKRIEQKISEGGLGKAINALSSLLILGGLYHWYVNSQMSYTYGKSDAEAQRGLNFALGGLVLMVLNPYKPQTHYLKYSDVGYQIDLYNANLQKELGVSE
ncbi:hypothetical protein A2311_03585 [candidate division WOR-1 bacterium RIFOXYB2_FULL_48_7]|uniref:DUF5683 domain-containing protein n=1 Tax=candidate division WOR-1 bacterium RIFOXYB2_FULL_48_7 TaxID=1802583 RepID=A0A1F4TSH4_UNCSA|nr:MAG: hypothetical protein A2311_03585 [candidate division WOR-1 bacterium RIFOXYB2_FULL_48_7]